MLNYAMNVYLTRFIQGAQFKRDASDFLLYEKLFRILKKRSPCQSTLLCKMPMTFVKQFSSV